MSRAASQPVAFATPAFTFHLAQARQRDAIPATPSTSPSSATPGWRSPAPPAPSTRDDGRMQTRQQWRTADGCRIPGALDAGGTPILVDPEGGPLTIARSGAITQGPRSGGPARPVRNSRRREAGTLWQFGVIPDRAATAALDFTINGFQQGYCRRLQRRSAVGIDAADDRRARLPERQLADRQLRRHDAERHPFARRT